MQTALEQFLGHHPEDLMEPDYPYAYTGEDVAKGSWSKTTKSDRFWAKIVDKCSQSPGQWFQFYTKPITPDRAENIEALYKGFEIRLKGGYVLARVTEA